MSHISLSLVIDALEAVYSGAGPVEAQTLMEALHDRGLTIVNSEEVSLLGVLIDDEYDGDDEDSLDDLGGEP